MYDFAKPTANVHLESKNGTYTVSTNCCTGVLSVPTWCDLCLHVDDLTGARCLTLSHTSRHCLVCF